MPFKPQYSAFFSRTFFKQLFEKFYFVMRFIKSSLYEKVPGEEG